MGYRTQSSLPKADESQPEDSSPLQASADESQPEDSSPLQASAVMPPSRSPGWTWEVDSVRV